MGIIMDCSLKFDYVNKELLVIVNHHVTVDLISDVLTTRQAPK